MKKIVLSIFMILFLSLGTVFVTPSAAHAASSTNCTTIKGNIYVLGDDVVVCMKVNYTNVSSTKKSIQSITINCAQQYSFSSGNALDGYTLQVKNAANGSLWSAGDANANVPKTGCSRTWSINSTAYTTPYFKVHYFAKARLSGQPDQEFVLDTFAPQ